MQKHVLQIMVLVCIIPPGKEKKTSDLMLTADSETVSTYHVFSVQLATASLVEKAKWLLVGYRLH